jgi:hypothetical protein
VAIEPPARETGLAEVGATLQEDHHFSHSAC